ncbi:uncharacterized protein LOC135810602 [Sycon ciliatum]|uniref:uncharacterized protein LOC135810602 n=1 Tax=Sycon ciliatum TaxID=27933 RepID=UPI0031F6EEE3
MNTSNSAASTPIRSVGRGQLLSRITGAGTSAAGGTARDSEVAAVSLNVKLPPYWAADPQVWFAQVESLFSTRRITSQVTKYQYVVGSLTPEYAAEVRDIILDPPAQQPYDALRERLIHRTQMSEQQRLRLLISDEELGDKKPTQLLRKLQQLVGENAMPEKLLRELFVSRLPQSAKSIVASCPASLPLQDLAEMADRIVEAAGPSTAVHAVRNTGESEAMAAIAALRDQVAALTTTVTELKQQHGRSRFRGQPRSRSVSPHSSGLCHFHRKFGVQARRCEAPCSWSSGNAPASQ